MLVSIKVNVKVYHWVNDEYFGKMGFRFILSVTDTITVDTMLNFGSDLDWHGDVTCKQRLADEISLSVGLLMQVYYRNNRNIIWLEALSHAKNGAFIPPDSDSDKVFDSDNITVPFLWSLYLNRNRIGIGQCAHSQIHKYCGLLTTRSCKYLNQPSESVIQEGNNFWREEGNIVGSGQATLGVSKIGHFWPISSVRPS